MSVENSQGFNNARACFIAAPSSSLYTIFFFNTGGKKFIKSWCNCHTSVKKEERKKVWNKIILLNFAVFFFVAISHNNGFSRKGQKRKSALSPGGPTPRRELLGNKTHNTHFEAVATCARGWRRFSRAFSSLNIIIGNSFLFYTTLS